MQLGFHTILVLSGGTRLEDLNRYAYRPDVVVESLAEVTSILEKADWQPPWYAPQGITADPGTPTPGPGAVLTS